MQQEHSIHLTKEFGRAPSTGAVESQIDYILAGTTTQARQKRGWKIGKTTLEKQDPNPSVRFPNGVLAHVWLTCNLDTDREPTAHTIESVAQELDGIIRAIATKGNYHHWNVAEVDDTEWTGKRINVSARVASDSEAIGRAIDAADNIGYAPFVLPDEELWIEQFDGLFGLDAAIARIRSAIEAAVMSDWRKRIHCILIGPPACGKTDICRRVGAAVGTAAYMEYDATATTQAGMIKDLEEREELPRILFVEEIEKAPQDSMMALLGMMDDRAEIRKVTAKKNIQRDTRMLVIATANDEQLLKKAAAGALYSRFSANKIYFHRPSRDILYRILEREVTAVGGDPEWINPTLDYAEAIGSTDPRELIGICLCGREKLLTGEYQEWLLETGIAQYTPDDESDEAKNRRSLEKLVSGLRERRENELEMGWEENEHPEWK